MKTMYPTMDFRQAEHLAELRRKLEETRFEYMIGEATSQELAKAEDAVDKYLASLIKKENQEEKAMKKKAEELREAMPDQPVEERFMNYFWKEAKRFASNGRTSVTVSLPVNRAKSFVEEVVKEGCSVATEAKIIDNRVVMTVKW